MLLGFMFQNKIKCSVDSRSALSRAQPLLLFYELKFSLFIVGLFRLHFLSRFLCWGIVRIKNWMNSFEHANEYEHIQLYNNIYIHTSVYVLQYTLYVFRFFFLWLLVSFLTLKSRINSSSKKTKQTNTIKKNRRKKKLLKYYNYNDGKKLWKEDEKKDEKQLHATRD